MNEWFIVLLRIVVGIVLGRGERLDVPTLASVRTSTPTPHAARVLRILLTSAARFVAMLPLSARTKHVFLAQHELGTTQWQADPD